MDLTTKKSYGDCEGPFGFPMASDAAKEAEKIWSKVDNDCKEIGYKRHTFLPEDIKIEKDERADISLITNDAVDRDNEVVLADGLSFQQFMKNPVVPFAHDYKSLPIGRALWVKRNRKSDKSPKNIPEGWLAKTRYTPAPENWKGNWFPDAVFHFVKEGDLRGKSIGFMPTEVRAPNEKEIEGRPELSSVSRIIAKATILEYSAVPVQSNPDALAISVGKAFEAGIDVPDVIYDAFGIYVPKSVTSGYVRIDGDPIGEVGLTTTTNNAANIQVSQWIPKEDKNIPIPHNVITEDEYRKAKISKINVDRAVKNALELLCGGV